MAMTLASVNREGPKLVSVVVTAIGKTRSACRKLVSVTDTKYINGSLIQWWLNYLTYDFSFLRCEMNNLYECTVPA